MIKKKTDDGKESKKKEGKNQYCRRGHHSRFLDSIGSNKMKLVIRPGPPQESAHHEYFLAVYVTGICGLWHAGRITPMTLRR